MEEEQRKRLERLKAVRGGHQGVLTKLAKEVDDLLADETLSNEAAARLNVVCEQLEGKMKVLTNLDGEIVSLCQVDDITREIDESEGIIAKLIECKRKIASAMSNPVSTSTISSHPVAATVRPAVKPRLPKLTLPKFRGVVTTWSSFWDSFKAAVHDNDSIPKIDKFNYLNSSLEGVAARTVQGLTLTEGNYDSAVELLKECFGKPQQIISVHMDKLLRIPTCTGDRLSLL